MLGNGRPAVSPHEQPVPIASLAKVMTAYLVLKHYPLHAGDSGRRFVVGQRRCRGHRDEAPRGSVGRRCPRRRAAHRAGCPHGDPVAVREQHRGARRASGRRQRRLLRRGDEPHRARAGDVAHDLHRSERLRRRAPSRPRSISCGWRGWWPKDETLAAMMATRSYWLPVAGEVTNTNTLLGQDGFVGMKTGSDDAAGGCFMFRSGRHTERRQRTADRRGARAARTQPDHRGTVCGQAAGRPRGAERSDPLKHAAWATQRLSRAPA